MKTKKVVACIIARTVSTRLPLKVLRDLYPHTSLLDFLVQNIKSQEICDEIYICTSNEPVDDILEDVAARNNVKIYRGSPNDVTERISSVGTIENADILVRITGDNPFTASNLIKEQVNYLISKELDYVRVIDLPVGATAEVFSSNALKECMRIIDPQISEYLMLYFFEPKNFRTGVIKAFSKDFSNYSLTVDTKEDLERTLRIIQCMNFSGKFRDFHIKEILDVITNDDLNVPHKIMEASGQVKLPYDELVSYEQFMKDMQRRIDDSDIMKLYE